MEKKIVIALNASELEDVIEDEFRLDGGEDNEKKDKKKKDDKA